MKIDRISRCFSESVSLVFKLYVESTFAAINRGCLLREVFMIHMYSKIDRYIVVQYFELQKLLNRFKGTSEAVNKKKKLKKLLLLTDPPKKRISIQTKNDLHGKNEATQQGDDKSNEIHEGNRIQLPAWNLIRRQRNSLRWLGEFVIHRYLQCSNTFTQTVFQKNELVFLCQYKLGIQLLRSMPSYCSWTEVHPRVGVNWCFLKGLPLMHQWTLTNQPGGVATVH